MILRTYAAIKNWFESEKGQSMVEYGMIIGLIALGVIVLVATLGDQIGALFTAITTAFADMLPTTP